MAIEVIGGLRSHLERRGERAQSREKEESSEGQSLLILLPGLFELIKTKYDREESKIYFVYGTLLKLT